MMTAYERLQAARAQDRPTSRAYIENLFTERTELHGDRKYADDPAIIGGIGYLGDIPVTFIGIERGRDLQERIRCNFGCPNDNSNNRCFQPHHLHEVVIGEGGSGGALGLSVANRVYMLENAVFSVISPEGCASILWEDASKAADAAECLKITAEDMKRFGVAEDVIEENFDSFDVMCEDLKARLLSDVQELEQYSGRVLSEKRYERFRKLGVYSEK